MIHLEVDPDELQAAVPFELDLHEGHAYVSLVAFTMRGMRPYLGGRLTAWMLKPIATHDFLNVRTYVRNGNEAGIFFMTEWLSNRLSAMLGPATFGLPYRFASVDYDHGASGATKFSGRVKAPHAQGLLAYSARLNQGAAFEKCEAGTLDEWLMERYTAFTSMNGNARFFRVWHEPWIQARAEVTIHENSLITTAWPLLSEARLAGANYSPGAFGVCLDEGGRHRRRNSRQSARICSGEIPPRFEIRQGAAFAPPTAWPDPNSFAGSQKSRRR